MKKIQLWLLFFGLITNVVFGWEITEEMNVHEPINEKAVEYFIQNFKTNPKYVLSPLDQRVKFDGVAWHSGYEWEIVLNNAGVSRKETFLNWIGIGGVDADVESDHGEKITIPQTNWVFEFEKPLRHFYDPEVPPKYLSDFSSKISPLFQNPKMDHVAWALHALDNPWSFDQSLLLYKEGMEAIESTAGTTKQSIKIPIGYGSEAYFNGGNFRENLFSASFRALGQTLHGIGDMCIPAHVRDDCHAGFDLVGGIDPVEAEVDFFIAKDILNGSINPPLSPKGKTVEELMVECAAFTNQNFFSNDTICNVEPSVGPTTFNKKVYKYPSFSDLDLKIIDSDTGGKSIRQVSKVFSNNNSSVVLCENSWVSGVFLGGYKFMVPYTAAEDQARVLLPLAVAAGAEVIDRFFPTMKLTQDVKETGKNGTTPLFTVSGDLTHHIASDPTWSSIGAIRYNGEGELQVNGKTDAKVTFVNGVMTPITGKTFTWVST